MKVENAASGMGKLSLTVCDMVDALASVKSDGWKYFVFPVSENENVKKVTKRQKRYADTAGVKVEIIHATLATPKFDCYLINVLFVYIVYVKGPFNANDWIMIIDQNIKMDVFYII